MEVVLDTNVAISAAINPKGPSAEIIRAWRAHSFIWVTSPPLLQELARTLRSSRIKRYLSWTSAELDEFIEAVSQTARVVVPERRLTVVKADPDDDRVVEAAVEAPADYIVSGDKALLDLSSYEDIPIITPARFVAILSATSKGGEPI